MVLRLRIPAMTTISRAARRLLADSEIVTGVLAYNSLIRGVTVAYDQAGDSVESGPLPASKAAIAALPRMTVTEEGRAKDCSICLDEICVGGEVTEMPCKHCFHSNCIEKWLKVRGSCPVCRFLMPVDDDGGSGDGRQRTPWLTFMRLVDDNS